MAQTHLVLRFDHDGLRFDQTVDLPLARDAVILGWADAATPLPDVVPYPHAIGMGFTSFIYVDGDGDGQIRLPMRTEEPPGV